MLLLQLPSPCLLQLLFLEPFQHQHLPRHQLILLLHQLQHQEPSQSLLQLRPQFQEPSPLLLQHLLSQLLLQPFQAKFQERSQYQLPPLLFQVEELQELPIFLQAEQHQCLYLGQ